MERNIRKASQLGRFQQWASALGGMYFLVLTLAKCYLSFDHFLFPLVKDHTHFWILVTHICMPCLSDSENIFSLLTSIFPCNYLQERPAMMSKVDCFVAIFRFLGLQIEVMQEQSRCSISILFLSLDVAKSSSEIPSIPIIC